MSEIPIKDEMTMEQLLREEESASSSKGGGVVTAHVVEVTAAGVLVDVGLKGEGFIPIAEFASQPKPPAVGDSFPAVIKRKSGPDGHPLVSMREAKDRAHRGRILEAKASQTPLEGTVLRQVKGGLIVDVGMEGFLPASQVDRRPVKDLKALVGQKIQVVVLELDEQKGGVVLSRRQLLEREAGQKLGETLKTLEAGKVVSGTVTSLTSFGAFVDIGGIEGLLRVSDVSWGRVDKLSDALSVGQTIEVKVLKYDAATRKVSLGRKQLLPHPWEGVQTRFPVNGKASGKVTSLTPFGAFVELEPGVEGLIHQSEFSWKERWAKPDQFLKVGDRVEVVVVSCQRDKEKIGLSLKRAQENPWEEAAKAYRPGARLKGTVTHLVPFGAFVRLPSGIEGLLRTADMSWTKTPAHPKELVQEGQELELVVLEVSPGEERISLGLKQTTPDPLGKYKPGQIVEGKVVRMTDQGAFIQLEADLEGFVHISEIPVPPARAAQRDPFSTQKFERPRLSHPSEALAQDQVVTGQVLKADRKTRKIEISIKKHDLAQERRLIKKYQGGREGITLGEMTDWAESRADDSSSE
jgi:small subunit ribosomal protein S1